MSLDLILAFATVFTVTLDFSLTFARSTEVFKPEKLQFNVETSRGRLEVDELNDL